MTDLVADIADRKERIAEAPAFAYAIELRRAAELLVRSEGESRRQARQSLRDARTVRRLRPFARRRLST